MFDIQSFSTPTKLALALLGIPSSLLLIKSTAAILLQDKLIYNGYFPPGSKNAVAQPEKYALQHSFEEHFFPSKDGVRLQLWTFKSLNAPAPKAQTLLYFQGNAGNIGHRMRHIRQLLDCSNLNIAALHYRGYGKSGGWSSETGIRRDSAALLDFLDTRLPELSRPKYLCFGQSLGGAVAIDLVSRYPDRFQGLIVENTFTSIRDMVHDIYPPFSIYHHLTPFLWNHWNSAESIQVIDCPILFLAGGQDEIVPPKQFRQLYKFSLGHSSNSKYKLFPRGLHDDTWKQPGYFDEISRFLRVTESYGKK